MTANQAPRPVTWKAPGAGLFIAYAAVGQAGVASVEQVEHAIACRSALRPPKTARSERWSVIERTDSVADDETFEARVEVLDADAADVVISREALTWMRGVVAGYAVKGVLAVAKKRLLESMDRAS